MKYRINILVFLLPMLLIGSLLGLFSFFYPAAHSELKNTLVPIFSTDTKVRFAVIGDFGQSGTSEADVATLVKSWNPDFIVSTGDNNYPNGGRLTIDNNIGKYYQEFIGSYSGSYGKGANQNRFFPAIGNHDWHSIICFTDSCRGAYFGYFSLPGNERYYDFIWGPIQFFILDSSMREPDGTSPTSVQGLWLQSQLKASTANWKIVVLHSPPYSSGQHGSQAYVQWPFAEWGASVVLSGHDHTYERFLVNGFPYFVNGLGGRSLYNFNFSIPESQVRFNQDYGAMFVEANPQTLTFKFITRTGEVVDKFTLPFYVK